jgi:hypothetical protein
MILPERSSLGKLRLSEATSESQNGGIQNKINISETKVSN